MESLWQLRQDITNTFLRRSYSASRVVRSLRDVTEADRWLAAWSCSLSAVAGSSAIVYCEASRPADNGSHCHHWGYKDWSFLCPAGATAASVIVWEPSNHSRKNQCFISCLFSPWYWLTERKAASYLLMSGTVSVLCYGLVLFWLTDSLFSAPDEQFIHVNILLSWISEICLLLYIVHLGFIALTSFMLHIFLSWSESLQSTFTSCFLYVILGL